MDESTGIDNKELLRLSQMSAQELLNECVKLKLALEKADRRAALFLSAYDRMKARYPDIDKDEYNPKWSWVNKIVFVLKKVDRPLSSAEMIELIKPHELGLQYSYHPAQNFSAYLNKAVRCRRVIAWKQGETRGLDESYETQTTDDDNPRNMMSYASFLFGDKRDRFTQEQANRMFGMWEE